MIKGYRKRMVIVSELNDSSIETAYFVMKEGSDESINENDIIKKANSLIDSDNGNTLCFSRGSNKGRKGVDGGSPFLFPFLSGFLLGGIFAAVLAAILFFL